MIAYIEKKRKEIKKPSANPRREIKWVSNQRALLNTIYKILCRELKPLHLVCDRCKINKVAEIHHSKGRRGFLLIMSFYFKYLCRTCHRDITDNSAEAINDGWSLPINSKTEYIFTDREVELINKYNIRTPKGVNIT